MRVTRIFTIDMGHRLSDYKGKCYALHGHTYKIEVTASASQLDKLGMIVDFGIIKIAFMEYVDKILDHKTMLYKEDPLNKKLMAVEDNWFVPVPFNPTAENIANFIKETLRDKLPKEIQLVKVRVWETPNSYADTN